MKIVSQNLKYVYLYICIYLNSMILDVATGHLIFYYYRVENRSRMIKNENTHTSPSRIYSCLFSLLLTSDVWELNFHFRLHTFKIAFMFNSDIMLKLTTVLN